MSVEKGCLFASLLAISQDCPAVCRLTFYVFVKGVVFNKTNVLQVCKKSLSFWFNEFACVKNGTVARTDGVCKGR